MAFPVSDMINTHVDLRPYNFCLPTPYPSAHRALDAIVLGCVRDCRLGGHASASDVIILTYWSREAPLHCFPCVQSISSCSLRSKASPNFLLRVYSAMPVVAKAAQLPQLPWFLMGVRAAGAARGAGARWWCRQQEGGKGEFVNGGGQMWVG